jgi:hypothetical protein
MRILALFVVTLCLVVPVGLKAQDQGDSVAHALWMVLDQGKVSADFRYRFETFDRDGAPFTGAAYAPTLRIALGYETKSYHGFSAYFQGAGVLVTGPADYSIPTFPSMDRPDRPTINEPRTVQLSQGYLKWDHPINDHKVAITVGRQEIQLNDGRFVSISNWRQIHETFDAARLDVDLTRRITFTYAFINRFYRPVGHDATDGKPPMHSDLLNFAGQKPGRINVSVYGLLLDYRSLAQYNLSTRTFGVRANGPFQINPEWSVLYTGEIANQRNFGSNPNYVNANYYLAELGPGWRGFGLKGGYALLGGRSSTDELTTPLANPFNGWTELFSSDPSVGSSAGLEAQYLTGSDKIRQLGDTTLTTTYYDYHSDSNRIHYGSELDWGLAYKVKKFSNRWEIGCRFGHYWADRLFTPALRASVYTQFML